MIFIDFSNKFPYNPYKTYKTDRPTDRPTDQSKTEIGCGRGWRRRPLARGGL